MTNPKNRKTSLSALAISLAKAGIPIRISQTVDGTTTVETLLAESSVEVNEWDVVLKREVAKGDAPIDAVLQNKEQKGSADDQSTKERVKEPIQRPSFYTIPDIMALMSVGRSTVYKLVKDGELKQVRLGSMVRISADSFDAFRARLEGHALKND